MATKDVLIKVNFEDKTSQAFAEIGKKLRDLSKDFEGVGKGTESISNSLQNVAGSANDSGGALGFLGGSLGAVVKSAGPLVLAFGAVQIASAGVNAVLNIGRGILDGIVGSIKFTINGFFDLAKAGTNLIQNGIQLTASLEQSRIAFKTLLGSTELADDAIKKISKTAKSTPFELPGLIAMTKQLVSAGLTVDDSIINLRALGDAVSAVGGGQAEMDRLIANMQQIKAVGSASAMDIKQFGFAAIPMLELLAEYMGKTTTEIDAMVSAGVIGFDEVSGALQQASKEGGRYFNAMADQSLSFNGLLSNIKDTAGIMLTDFIESSGIFDIAKGKAEQFLGVLEKAGSVIAFYFNRDSAESGIGQFFSSEEIARIEQFFDNTLQPKLDALKTKLDELEQDIKDAWKEFSTDENGEQLSLFDVVDREIEEVKKKLEEWKLEFLGIQESFENSLIGQIISQWTSLIKDGLSKEFKAWTGETTKSDTLNAFLLVAGAIGFVISMIALMTATLAIGFSAFIRLALDVNMKLIEMWKWIFEIGKKIAEVMVIGVFDKWRDGFNILINKAKELVREISKIKMPDVGGALNRVIPGRATGGFSKGWTMVGEQGPELINMGSGGMVKNARDSAKMVGSDVVINISVGSVDDQSRINQIAETIKRIMAEDNRLNALNIGR